MFGFYRLHEMGFLNYSKRVLRFGYNNAEIELAANINQPLPKQKTTKNEAKIFVLDTNVLLHDPQCLHKFEDNTVAIPVEVLEELDRKKSAPGELGFSARKIHRDLRSLFDEKLAVPPEMKGQGSSALSCDLPNGGRLIVVINDYFVSGDDKSAIW